MYNDDTSILANVIETPDGTLLYSRNGLEYNSHTDKINGEVYIVDGAYDYLKRTTSNNVPYIERSVYTDSPFEEIRKYFCRGSYGKNGDEDLHYIKLCDLTDEHLENIIAYEEKLKYTNLNGLFIKEKYYRRGLKINEILENV